MSTSRVEGAQHVQRPLASTATRMAATEIRISCRRLPCEGRHFGVGLTRPRVPGGAEVLAWIGGGLSSRDHMFLVAYFGLPITDTGVRGWGRVDPTFWPRSPAKTKDLSIIHPSLTHQPHFIVKPPLLRRELVYSARRWQCSDPCHRVYLEALIAR